MISTETIGLSRGAIEAIIRGQHGDPFAVLGMHGGGDAPLSVRVFAPPATEVAVLDEATDEEVARLERIDAEGFFAGTIDGRTERFSYRLRLSNLGGSWEIHDPYSFPLILGEMDVYLLGEGSHRKLYEQLGAHPATIDGVEGFTFAVWAPNARRVSVVGHFNAWDGRRHPMRKRLEGGIWELFVPGIERGDVYKYEIIGADGAHLPLKADPFAFAMEHPPSTASIASGLVRHEWNDEAWMSARAARNALDAPISIYEVHLGSWRRGEGNTALDYETLADHLIPYLEWLGFTHVELMPISEHPFTGSWGYQPIGLYAPTSRFGGPEGFARFVDRFHQAGIGVIIDWVPAHFPTDGHGLVRFDGTALYEHEDPRKGFHRDWNTLIYNLGRREVWNFLLANGLYWLDRFHIDALRVDAVASMLYLDYSREEGEWVPNEYGGRENLENVAFLREVNTRVFGDYPGATTAAEESTAWPAVSRPVDMGGLGFGYKWNMGWMHDTLEYMGQDPIYRRYHHNKMTFGIHYGFSENFILPISHDEVVYGKGSMLGKMPGDLWQKFANLRAYYGFMWTHPGKKLLFMGSEFGQLREWNHDQSLDWHLTQDPMHEGVQKLIRELNRVYREVPALHQLDTEAAGFEWIDGGDVNNSVLVYQRNAKDGSEPAVVVCNFTPTVREGYRVGVPRAGAWREVLNTDDGEYGGSGVGNGARVNTEDIGWHGREVSLNLTLPPLATMVLAPVEAA